MTPSGILLIDDHALFRSGLCMVLREAVYAARRRGLVD